MDSPAVVRRRRRRRVPDENRKRAPRACDRCKARKSKCIETPLGPCQRCQQNSLSCRFERERSPAVGTDSAISSLEIGKIADSSAAIPTNAQTSPDDSFSIDGHPAERFMWPRFLSRLRETFSLDSDPAPEEQNIATIQAQTLRAPALQPDELQRLRKAVDAFPPRAVADFLLSVCIEHGTDSFFYFNQTQFLSEIDQFYTDPSSRLRSDCSFICLAHAAFALGSQWTTLAKPEGTGSRLLPEDGDPGRIFYNRARSLIPDVLDRPCLRSVQAPYVMGVYLLPASAIGSSYIYLGLALRKALALDLHLNSDDPSISDEEKEIRRRIWWSIYSLERSSTVKLNRPRSINTGIITVSLPQVYPPLDNNQKFNNIQHQVADARLIMILDRVAEPFEWAATSCGPNEFEKELKEWKRSLPPNLRLSNVNPKTSEYRATFHLYLNYYFTWIAMGKVSVVTVVRARLRYRFGRDLQPPQIGKDVESYSRSCIKAAKKMLQLFEDLHRSGNLTRFSFTDFQGCSIATIVMLLAGILERDSSYEIQVKFGLECLRKMAEGNSAAKMGVGFVEALQSIANEAVDKLRRNETYPRVGTTDESLTSPPPPPPPLPVSEYDSWIKWLSRQNQVSNETDDVPSRFSTSDTTVLPLVSTEAWPLAQPSNGFTSWDGAAALQQLSVPPFEEVAVVQQNRHMSATQSIDNGFFSTLYNDDQTFLMGLTGMDVLGFSEFQEY